MAQKLQYLDAFNIKRKIRTQSPVEERCRLCEQLLELYPSRRNRQFVNQVIRKCGGSKLYGAWYDLNLKLNGAAIARHRKIILANRAAKELAKKTGTPVGTTMKVMGSDGKQHWSDGVNDLGVVNE